MSTPTRTSSRPIISRGASSSRDGRAPASPRRASSRALDPFHNREGFLAAARRLEIPVLVIYGEHTPRRSRAEMDALAALPNVESQVLQHGALGIHEELPAEIAPLIEAFLDRRP
jgi:pimeloyl-ACP methyl ester carboxylesterase